MGMVSLSPKNQDSEKDRVNQIHLKEYMITWKKETENTSHLTSPRLSEMRSGSLLKQANIQIHEDDAESSQVSPFKPKHERAFS